MSLGTITIGTEAGGAPSQSVFHEQFTLVGDSAYATGGTLLFGATLAAAFPLRSFTAASIVKCEGNATAYYLTFIPSTGALKAYVRATGVEVANAVNLSAVTFDMYAVLK